MSLSFYRYRPTNGRRAFYRPARDYRWQPSLQWVTGRSIIQTMTATSLVIWWEGEMDSYGGEMVFIYRFRYLAPSPAFALIIPEEKLNNNNYF